MHIHIVSGNYEMYMDFLHRIDEEFHLTHEESVWVKFNQLLIRKAFDNAWNVLCISMPDERLIGQQGIYIFRHVIPVGFYHNTADRCGISGGLCWHNNHVVMPSPRCNRALVTELTCSIHT